MPTSKKTTASSQKAEKVTFKSKYLEYRIVLEQSDFDIIGRHKVRVAGKDAQFHNGLYTTDDLEIIEALREHKNYGTDFIELEKEDEIADNALPKEPSEPTEPPVVKPQKRGARSTADAPTLR